jgi:hypothetical protein
VPRASPRPVWVAPGRKVRARRYTMSALTIFDVVESSDSVRLPLASVPLGTLCALVVLSCRQPAAPLEIKIDDQARIVDRARLEAILSSPVFSGPGPPGAIPTEVVVTCYMNSDSSGYARMERAFQFDRGLIVDATTSASFAEISRRWLLEVGYTPPRSPLTNRATYPWSLKESCYTPG